MTNVLTALPPETLDGHVGILATSGGGKTYGAKTAVEDLLDAGRRVCVIDPTGVWWGLRANPDGEEGGYPVAIIGGDHADVALSEGAGAALARAVAEGAFSAIIDVSRLTVGARTRLFTDFAEELARVNRRALHLVIDEAHLFIPQGRVNDPQSGKMVGAANHLVSGGRALGLRLILVSQRPAKVHKDSLTQVATLVPMWMTAPQDTAAVKAWVADVADPAQGRELISSLPTLQVGHGWVWSPRAGVFSRIVFRQLRTFDSSRAPALDEAPPTARLSALPIEELRAALTAEDPAAEAAPAPAKRASKAELEAAEARGYQRGLADGEARGVSLGIARAVAAVEALRDASDPEQPVAATQPAEAARRQSEPPPAPARTKAKPPRAAAPAAPSNAAGSDLGAKQKVLDALAWWSKAGFDPVRRERACVLAGYSPKASTFGVYVAELAREGLIRTATPGHLALTDAGWARALAPSTNLLDAARGLLTPAEARTFDTLRFAGPPGLRREVLADQLGLSRSASTLGVYVGRLISLGFVETTKPGTVRVVDWLLKEPKP